MEWEPGRRMTTEFHQSLRFPLRFRLELQVLSSTFNLLPSARKGVGFQVAGQISPRL